MLNKTPAGTFIKKTATPRIRKSSSRLLDWIEIFIPVRKLVLGSCKCSTLLFVSYYFQFQRFHCRVKLHTPPICGLCKLTRCKFSSHIGQKGTPVVCKHLQSYTVICCALSCEFVLVRHLIITLPHKLYTTTYMFSAFSSLNTISQSQSCFTCYLIKCYSYLQIFRYFERKQQVLQAAGYPC